MVIICNDLQIDSNNTTYSTSGNEKVSFLQFTNAFKYKNVCKILFCI